MSPASCISVSDSISTCLAIAPQIYCVPGAVLPSPSRCRVEETVSCAVLLLLLLFILRVVGSEHLGLSRLMTKSLAPNCDPQWGRNEEVDEEDGELFLPPNHADKDEDSPFDIEEGHVLLCLSCCLDRAIGVFCTLCTANSSSLKLRAISLGLWPSLFMSILSSLTSTLKTSFVTFSED